MNDITKIKISELTSGDSLSSDNIKKALIPIDIVTEDSDISDTYKLTLGNHFYTKVESDSKHNELKDYIDIKINGVPTNKEYDETFIRNDLNDLKNRVDKIEYGPLNPSKILVSDPESKIIASDIDSDKLLKIKDWAYDDTIYEKIKALENKIEELESNLNGISANGSTYKEVEEIEFSGEEYTAKKRGILMCDFYEPGRTAAQLVVYINELTVARCHYQYSSKSGIFSESFALPVNAGDKIKILLKNGNKGARKAYIIY